MRRALATLFFGAVLTTAGCADETASPRSGVEALLHVSGAQFIPGVICGAHEGCGLDGGVPPASDGGVAGPTINTFKTNGFTVFAGQVGVGLSGLASKTTTAVTIGFPEDLGYWLKPVGIADAIEIGEYNYSLSADFSRQLAPGPHQLVLRAVDAQGVMGRPYAQDFTVQGLRPSGDLVISLTWDTEADLDLHVIAPSGVEIWSGKVNSLMNGAPIPDAGLATSGVLDFDSNAQCVIDGRRMEDVVFGTNAPSGHYVVRVDAFSLCGEAVAHWDVAALVGVDSLKSPDGQQVGAARGAFIDLDTRGDHRAGAGLTVLEFDLQ